MNAIDLPKRNRFRWFLALSAMILIVVAVAGMAFYPRWQAQQWEEELWNTTDSFEALFIVQKLILAQNDDANAVLTEYANKLDNAVFAEEHRVVVFFDETTGQRYSATRWSADNMSPDITAKFVNPRIVENLPDAVTIAVTNSINGSVCLFVYTYKHTGYICDLAESELTPFENAGFWNRYVQLKGNPIAQKREKGWHPAAEKSYQDWKQEMERKFSGPIARRPKAP